MILIVIVCIILVTNCHQVESKKITVNNNGRNTTECCVDGKCPCSSLFSSLQHITDSTTINITSESVELHSNTMLNSTSDITITSNKTLIKCNNTGSVSFINTTNVIIRGITWDQCGNPNDPHVDGGMSFTSITKLTIDSCTFQYSQLCAVSLSSVSDDITIKNSNFISNGLRKTVGSGESDCGGLKITDAIVNTTVAIVIYDSFFSGNGKSIDRKYYIIYGLFIDMSDSTQANLTLFMKTTNFMSNFGGMYLLIDVDTFSTFVLSEVNVSNNINEGVRLQELQVAKGDVNLMILNSVFSNNGNGGLIGNIFAYTVNRKINVTIENTNFTDNRAVNFSNIALSIAISSSDSVHLSVYVQRSNFVNNKNGTIYISTSQGTVLHLVYFHEVVIKECIATGSSSGSGAVSISLHSSLNNTYYFQSVFFISNKYLGITGGALFLKTVDAENDIFIKDCVFQNNIGMGEGAAIYVADGVVSSGGVYKTIIKLTSTNFTSNSAGDSIVYVEGGNINYTRIDSGLTRFINNNGTALRLFMSQLTFYDYVLFENNTANSGAALYLEQGSQVYFGNKHDHNVTVQFVNNTATQYGGAIYTDLPSTCPINGVMFHKFHWDFNLLFMNSKAGIIGNSMYFNIHKFCKVNTNVNSSNSLLYLPYKFNYNSEMLNTSIVTSPHSIVLYFPNHDGSYISNETVFIRNKILGKAITFTGAVFDYFSSRAEPTQFHVQCSSGCTSYILADDRLLVDNVSLLGITLSGNQIDFDPVNITFELTSILASFNKQITLQLIIELSPCYSGYFHNVHSKACVCYHHQDIVECYDDYNEIKRGYWFGAVTGPSKPTVSLCPSRYCYFGKHRKETRQGYCLLPSASDDQCHSHRTGVACGECKSGYTLAYDSPDCIHSDKCSAGMTVLVIVLTILYWIAVVAVVFVLMHFSRKYEIPSDYAYGIIYYYSIVDILLDNNPYISDAVFLVVAVLSSFAKLTPQLFGQLCLVKGLSGIDQQFIHYIHALAVLLMLLIIVLVARCFPRIAFYVRRYILRVICILLLLSYTSLASTSFQLLRAIHYPGYDGLYVYVSPDMKYFNNRHAFYGVVALLCGAIVVIGLPLFLLLEPLILSRWFNFVKIMPLLDQFQSCYKDNYRWFAAYYLICRQVIIIIVYFSNNNYYEMLYYLQTACVVIAMLHIWIQPYKSSFLNAFDGVVLLTIILVVNANTFTFLSSATSVIITILVLLPLIVFSVASSKDLILRYAKKLISRYTNSQDQQQQYSLLDSTNTDDDRDSNTNYGRYLYIYQGFFQGGGGSIRPLGFGLPPLGILF